MKNNINALIFVATIAIAGVFTATTARAQLQDPNTVPVAMLAAPPAYTLLVPTATQIYTAASLMVVCQARREQFSDERGWRVREVLVCR